MQKDTDGDFGVWTIHDPATTIGTTMADLLDIAPATAVEVVKINGNAMITVRGLHGNAIASIVARFPEPRAVARRRR